MLFLAEVFARPGVRVAALETPKEIDKDRFAAYAFYANDTLNKLALINTNLYYANSMEDFSVAFDILGMLENTSRTRGHGGSVHESDEKHAWVKRMTAPFVDTKDTSQATWAGQSFENGDVLGVLDIEKVDNSGMVRVRGSEAVLILFNKADVYGI
jgi:hypothetical protein